ncbi:MAG TPA: FHA domain-containing protein [Gemmatimonadaceae bacterium]|nr:FHA domain-containing protein [Gemmatimonadaceae bacterium]
MVAVLTLGADRSVAIRRGSPASTVRVNGVQLGAEPTPLIHGDKIELAGVEMLFGDEKKGGGTQLFAGIQIPDLAGDHAPAPARPTAATGGRLVSLVDGREYAVPQSGLTLGRDAGCDVVVPGGDVSRRHADIAPGPRGYEVSDSSTNGVFVNGERIRQPHVLGRGDVIRVGGEEFRFYADVAQSAEPTPAMPIPRLMDAPPGAGRAAAASRGPSGSAAPAESTPPAGGVEPGGAAPASAPAPRPAPTPAPAPAQAAMPSPAPMNPPKPATAPAPAPAPATPAGETPRSVPATPERTTEQRPVLATLEVIAEGMMKGRRFELRLPLIHVGRGEHNDVVIADDSVSDSHAKLQKRDDGWYVVDMGSTNGTYLAGRRISGDGRLEPECDLRVGGIRMRFRARADAMDDAKGTRTIAGVTVAEARRAAAAAAAASARAPDPESRSGIPVYVWVIALVLLGLAVYFILQGQGR